MELFCVGAQHRRFIVALFLLFEFIVSGEGEEGINIEMRERWLQLAKQLFWYHLGGEV
jgi:hypothetical protein